MHWTMVLCHAEEPAQVGLLLEDARRWGIPPASSETHSVLYLEWGITSEQARSEARWNPMVMQLSRVPPVFVAATPSELPLEMPRDLRRTWSLFLRSAGQLRDAAVSVG